MSLQHFEHIMLKSWILYNWVCRWVSKVYPQIQNLNDRLPEFISKRKGAVFSLMFSFCCSLQWLSASTTGWFLTAVSSAQLYSTLVSLTGLQPLHLTLPLCSSVWPLGQPKFSLLWPRGDINQQVVGSQPQPEKRQEDTDRERKR